MFCFVCHVMFELYVRVSTYKLYHNTYLETISQWSRECQKAICKHKPLSTVGQN